MKFYLLLALSQLMLGLAHFTEKLFAKKSNDYMPTTLLYSAGIAISSLFIYSVMAAFDLSIDAPLIMHALGFGLLYAASMISIFVSLKRMNMVVYSVFSKSSSILICIIGILFYGDAVTFPGILSIVLLSISILLPLLETKKLEGSKKSIVNLIICIAIMLISTGVTLIIKNYTLVDGYTTERASALYFYANIFTFIFLAVTVLFMTRKPRSDGKRTLIPREGIGLKATFLKVRPALYILVPVVATVANIPTIIQAYCMENIDLSIYTVFMNAAASLVLFCISRFIFKEKSSVIDIISLVLSTLAGIVTVF